MPHMSALEMCHDKALYRYTGTLALKKRILNSTVSYAAENWTSSLADRKKLEAFEMWI